MKIPLKFHEKFNLFTLPALISIPSARVLLRNIEFLVDTGSNLTFLDENDLERLQISKKLLSKSDKQPHVKIGGGTFELYKLENISLYLITQDEKSVKVDMPEIEVSAAVSRKDFIRGAESSILGTDFIVNQKMTLHLDSQHEEYYLEKRES